MWQITVRWSNPYTQPPEGKSFVKGEFLEKTSCCFDWENRDKISELSKEYGYCVALTKLRENEIKKKVFSEESKLKIRKKRCVNRIKKNILCLLNF